MRPAVAVALALVAATSVRSALAQDPTMIIVFGSVRDGAGVGVKGAELWINGTSVRVVSDDSGGFRIDHAPSGMVTLMVRRLGYRPDHKRFTLQAGDTKQVKFVLDGALDELDTVLVTGQRGAGTRMQEFWERRAGGLGFFITRADIERQHPGRTVDLFRQVMGVRIIAGPSGTRLASGRASPSPYRTGSSAASSSCSMQYYMDGIFLAPGTFTIDEIPPEMIEAIEIYRGPSEIPARYRQRETACGLIVIWTREPPPRAKKEP
jgi:hypothetical protein